MSPTPATNRFHWVETAARRSLPHVVHCLRLTFLSGPKQLLTSRISGKCATVMTMMCAPSLLFCAILTLPALIFQSPQQNAYFHFAKAINDDPTRWIVLTLAAVCAVMSMAVPATMPGPSAPNRY